MKCMNAHDNPEDARFCQECGVSLQQQSAEEQAQEALQRLQAKQEEPQEDAQEAPRESSLGSRVKQFDLAAFLQGVSAKQYLAVGVALMAIVGAMVIGLNAGGSDNSSSGGSSDPTTVDTTPVEPTVVMTKDELAASLADGRTWTDGSVGSSAYCIEASVDADGSGSYQCMVTFTNGTQISKQVVVDSSGGYVTTNS